MSVAVLDIGKTNLKIHLLDENGMLLAERSRVNRSLPGPPWLHYDLPSIEDWLIASLVDFSRQWEIDAFVSACHGSGGVLVDDDGPVLQPIDYESEVPAGVAEEYASLMPPFARRGSVIQRQAGHFAQQMLMMQRAFPSEFGRARHFLPLPQYWAWRLTGVPSIDTTMLGAQSQLVNPLDRRSTGIVEQLGWGHLLPKVVPPYQVLGTPRPGLNLPPSMQVLAGIHDSTANLYGYQAAGFEDFALLSTGTWIVGMCPSTPAAALDEEFGMTVTSDVEGHPVAGVLAMGGREYAVIAGGSSGRAVRKALQAVVDQDVLAMPSFVDNDGVFPSSAGRGRIEGPVPNPAGRIALATLYNALVADICLDLMRSDQTIVIDGGFTVDPAFASLMAALRPNQLVLVNHQGGGTAAGAALLWTHENLKRPARLRPEHASPLHLDGLARYRAHWRDAVARHIQRPLPRSCSGFPSTDHQE
ncbi:MAG TPA: hypothetical protein VHL31_25715 [Geminicoccus sp.]|jgi:sugar (pentulose or hexulose) kinase|uniref:hypothetical protein n=1 Tax=Geminicoccus sp. TaxID=2024832 RepID=UPI002E370369|nr:hypothetical protein [Geminicoccus sp.]HEX2529675.1 hypothetical protein [Geminicoccus sp.]